MRELRAWIGIAVVLAGFIYQTGRLTMQVDNLNQKVAEVSLDLKQFIYDTNLRRERGQQP